MYGNNWSQNFSLIDWIKKKHTGKKGEPFSGYCCLVGCFLGVVFLLVFSFFPAVLLSSNNSYSISYNTMQLLRQRIKPG